MLEAFLSGPLRKTLRRFPIFVSKMALCNGVKPILLMPLIGIINFIGSRKIDKGLWYLITLIALGFCIAVTQTLGSESSLVRLAQLFSMVCFAQFLLEHFKSVDWQTFEKYLLAASSLYLVLEYFIVGTLPKQFLPGIVMPRLEGIVGESNYSGFLCALVASSLWNKQYKWWGGLGALTVIATSSRVAAVVLIVGALGPICRILPRRVFCGLMWAGLIFLLLYPFWLYGLDKIVSIESQNFINNIYSGRYTIHLSYFQIWLDHPFGVGYFNGPNLFPDYVSEGSKLVAGGYRYATTSPPWEYELPAYQQHSLYIHVLTEFGILGYVLLSLFLTSVMREALRVNLTAAYIFLIACCGFLTLNVLTDFSFYYALVRFGLSSEKY